MRTLVTVALVLSAQTALAAEPRLRCQGLDAAGLWHELDLQANAALTYVAAAKPDNDGPWQARARVNAAPATVRSVEFSRTYEATVDRRPADGPLTRVRLTVDGFRLEVGAALPGQIETTVTSAWDGSTTTYAAAVTCVVAPQVW